jgi:hypothetical protein
MMRNENKILVGEPERNRPLGKCKSTLKNKIRTELKETGWEDVD